MPVEVQKNPWKAALGGGDRLRDGNGYRMRAVGVCLRGEGENQEILLVSSGVDNNGWSVPGGGVERGETHEDAVVRELMEEAGVTAQAIHFAGIITDDIKRHHSSIFVMAVSAEHPVWEEGRYGRRREWYHVSKAVELLQEKHQKVLRLALSLGGRKKLSSILF